MKVKCIVNCVEEADENLRNRYINKDLISGALDDLQLGREYLVICKEQTIGGYTYVYLPEVGTEYGYPSPYPIELFEVIDHEFPDGWCEVETRCRNNNILLRTSFSEWASNDLFYERLVEGDCDIVNLYSMNLSKVLQSGAPPHGS